MTGHGSPVTDIIVIGSGPAGCAAAATGLKAGLQVVIVTEEVEQNPLTGSAPAPLESIHPGVSSLLKQIGAAGAETDATCALYAGIYAGGSYSPLGEDATGIWQGMHIRRDIFNAQLLHRVRSLGVEVRFNEKADNFILDNHKVVGIKTGSIDLYAKYIVDATGKNGVAGKKLNFKHRFFSPPLVCWTGISEVDESFPFDQGSAHFIPHHDGWTWLAPQLPGYCAWTRLSVKGEKTFSPPEELKDYDIMGKIQVANMRWRLYRPVCSEGIVLCGDAAGILDPAAGQGIFNALMSGIVAADTVALCVKEPDFAAFHLAQYDDWFVRQFEMKVGQLKEYYREHNISIGQRGIRNKE